MDPISDLVRSWKIPVGKWGKVLIDFVVTYFQWLFDALKVSLNFVVETTTAGLLALPPVLLAVLIAGFAYWLQKSWKLALGVLVGLLFILNQGLWMIEAGESFGATKRQLLWKVELPAAMPSIMAGLTQCIMLSLSMVVFATLIGAPSLGNPVNKALANRNIPLGIEAGLAIVVLAIILDRMLAVKAGAKK